MQKDEDRNTIKQLVKDTGAPEYIPGNLKYEYDQNHLKVYEDKLLVASVDLSRLESQLKENIRKEILVDHPEKSENQILQLAEERLRREIEDANSIESQRTKRNLLFLLEAVALPQDLADDGKFNPVFLLGETAGGKSSLTRYLTQNILGQGYTRIQVNERSDELDWFGSYEPRELSMSLDRAYRIVSSAMERGDWVRIKKALNLWKKGYLSEEDLAEIKMAEKVSERIAVVDEQASEQISAIIKKAVRADWLEDESEKKRAGDALKAIAYLIDNNIMNVELEFREGRLLSAIRRGDTVVLVFFCLSSAGLAG